MRGLANAFRGAELRRLHLEHVFDALDRQEPVRLLLFPDAVEEDGQVVVVVQLADVNLPVDGVLRAPVVHRDGQVAPLVKLAELRKGRGSLASGDDVSEVRKNEISSGALPEKKQC